MKSYNPTPNFRTALGQPDFHAKAGAQHLARSPFEAVSGQDARARLRFVRGVKYPG